MGSILQERVGGKTGFPSSGILPITKSLQFTEHGFPKFNWNDVATDGYNGWIFPGKGEAYPTCGTFHVVGCLTHNPGYFKRIKDTCDRAECPDDYKIWLVRSTKYITKRIKVGEPNRYRKPIHVTVSPGKDAWSKFDSLDGYRKTRRKAIRIAKKAGMIGGALIFHPYRDTGTIKDPKWYFSPHFHILGYGWVVQTPEIFRKTGWIVKNHRVRKSIGATAYYQLSHAGVKTRHHVISWFGALSTRALKVERDKNEEFETCPVCDSRLRRVIYYGLGDNPMSDPEISDKCLDTNYWKYR